MPGSYILGVVLGATMVPFLCFVALPVSLKVDIFLQWRFRISSSMTIICTVLIMILMLGFIVFLATQLSDRLVSSHSQYLGGFALGFVLGGLIAAALAMLRVGPFKRRGHNPPQSDD